MDSSDPCLTAAFSLLASGVLVDGPLGLPRRGATLVMIRGRREGQSPPAQGLCLRGLGGSHTPALPPSGAGPHLLGPPARPCLHAACLSAQVFGVGTDVGISAPRPARSAQPGTSSSDGGQPQGAPVSEARPGPPPRGRAVVGGAAGGPLPGLRALVSLAWVAP